jgi:hypothetical protein
MMRSTSQTSPVSTNKLRDIKKTSTSLVKANKGNYDEGHTKIKQSVIRAFSRAGRAFFYPSSKARAAFRKKAVCVRAYPTVRHLSSFILRGVRVITSVFRRLSMPLALLLGGVVLSGCSSEENIPLKKLDPKLDAVLDLPGKDYKEKRKAFGVPGGSSKIGHDPTGVSSAPASQ